MRLPPIGLIQQILTSVSRSFRKAFQEELVAAKQNPDKWEAVQTTNFGNMTLKEAQNILNVEEVDNRETISEKAGALLSMNDKKNPKNNGIGSGYLESKILNAKERLEYELEQLADKK